MRTAVAASPSALAVQAGCATSQPGDGTVQTESGPVSGTTSGSLTVFKGVPYAAPPVGDLRFRPPAPRGCWSGTLAASDFGSICPQFDRMDSLTGDEDCLTLNIWTPNATSSANMPVLFFIHGGGNVQGASSLPLYDGSALAQAGPSVVVTVNYRLGALGFLAAPALDSESANGVSGNYGILDQIAALTWVRSNIGNFGGDASRVMIFGQSAGGVDVCTLVASPLVAGLFSRAVIESGGCNQPSLARAEAVDTAVIHGAGCDASADIPACLRALPFSAVVSALKVGISVTTLGSADFGPVVDGYVLPATPFQALRSGNFNQVPLMIGTTADETAGLAPPPIADEAAYEAVLTRMYGASNAAAVLQQYPSANFATPHAAYIQVTTDADFVCPARDYAAAAATGGSAPVYRYFFTHVIDYGPGRTLGAFHALDLSFEFDTLFRYLRYTPPPDEIALGDAMVGYWNRFAATGDPNGAGAVAWPRYDAGTDPYIQFDSTITAGQGVRTANCDFWDALRTGQMGQ